MIQNYKVITLCGSTRFKEQFIEVQKRLTLEGCNAKSKQYTKKDGKGNSDGFANAAKHDYPTRLQCEMM